MRRAILQEEVSWKFVTENPGTYQLKDSRELFVISSGGRVNYWIPDEQNLGPCIYHDFWSTSRFLPMN